MNIYELVNIKKYYKNGSSSILALDIPWLSLEEGKFYIVYGPNAAGKTTLLNLLAFLDTPSEGEIIFNTSKKMPTSEITLVMQDPYFFKTTVLNNVTYGLRMRFVNKKRIMEQVKPVMEELGLWKIKDKVALGLSGGEKQRLALARAIVLQAFNKVLLLDEPTAHLDNLNTNLIETFITNIARRDKTIIMSTNDINQAHRVKADEVIYLSNGQVLTEI